MDEVNYRSIKDELQQKNVTLIAVSKTKPVTDLQELYNIGQRDFGENYVQEILEKEQHLPKDIHWHFIGHLQSNKVKNIAPFVHLIHSVDSLKLLTEINKQAEKNNRVIDCLLQIHIAEEETKFGFDEAEVVEIMKNFDREKKKNVKVIGLMGMASFSDDETKIRNEFKKLNAIYKKLQASNPAITMLSMGMSSDYKIAIEEGSNMVRIGSLLFGKRGQK